jgi:hypothetical protein
MVSGKHGAQSAVGGGEKSVHEPSLLRNMERSGLTLCFAERSAKRQMVL